MKILFLGETYRADAQTWIKGIESASGVKIQTKELPKSGSRISRVFQAFSFFLNLFFSKETYDITLAERATSYGFFSLLVNSKIRVVAQQGITDAFPEVGFAGWYKRIFQRAIYTRADLIHAWGYVMTYAMLESGAAPAKIKVLPKGLNLDNFAFYPETENRKHTAIVTRSLFDIYRHEEILEAIFILKNLGILLDCIMIGTGEREETLKEKTIHLGLQEHIKWIGRIPNDELPNYLGQAQIYIAVPETEGVSASLFEAMACGCFPIVTDLPANRAFIRHGENGLLVPVGKPNLLANEIAKYLMNSKSFRKGIIENRGFIERNCDLKRNMSSFYQTYQTLVNQK
ncbi:MAG: glycosyltransferase [Algoriphagus sp.]|nr:glycosyltransferase [Algoriphagus sp.]